MTKLTFALLVIFALTATSFASKYTVDDEEMQLLWSVWKDAHGKNYTDAEEAHRLNIFTENYNQIIAHNAQKNSTVTLGLGRFADISADEFKSQHTGGFDPTIQPTEGEQQAEDNRFLASLPSSVDWRAKGAVTSVKNQLQCNGCWAFAAAASLEALHYIKTGSLVSFSEQQLIDCDRTSNGCRGGSMATALTYTAQSGVELESNYPFADRTGTCKYSSSRATKVNRGHTSIRSNNANALMSAIVSQPVMVAIESASSVFQHYKSGVITSGCGTKTDHAVLAVGYTTVNGIKSFIVKNSYGTAWGQRGYVYISAGGSGAGVCGILSYPTIPTA